MVTLRMMRRRKTMFGKLNSRSVKIMTDRLISTTSSAAGIEVVSRHK